MANYLYKTILFINTTNVVGINVSQNNTDKAAFETNGKPTAKKVSGITIGETTFEILKSYTDFVALLLTPLTWASVKYEELPNLKYILYIDSATYL